MAFLGFRSRIGRTNCADPTPSTNPGLDSPGKDFRDTQSASLSAFIHSVSVDREHPVNRSRSVNVGAYVGGISAVSHRVSVSSVSMMTRPIGSSRDVPTAFSTSHLVTTSRLPISAT